MSEGELIPLGKLLLGLVLLGAVAVFAQRLAVILRLIRAGRAENRLDHFWTRLSYALLYIFGQSRVFRNRVVGAAHLVIFYGFLVIGVGTLNMLWRGFLGHDFIPFITESTIFPWLLDILAVLVVVAVLVSAYRRYVVHPAEVHNTLGAALVLSVIFLLMASLLLIEAAGHRLNAATVFSPLGDLLSTPLSGMDRGQLAALESTAWWAHILLVAGFLVYIPYSKHMHLLVCPFNEFLRSLRPKGEMAGANIDSPELLGAGSFSQLSWKQLVDIFACTECGRCLQYCPAFISGRSLAPRQMILDLRHGLLSRGQNGTPAANGKPRTGAAAVPEAIGREAVWACTTCRSCQEHCPVFIEHVDKVVEARRFLLDSEGASPSLTKALEGMALLGNPQTLPPSERAAVFDRLNLPQAAPALDAEIVLWTGCSAAYDPAAQDVIRALVSVLKAAGVQVAILGATEKCCGDPARRTGEEGLFQELASYNIANLKTLGVRKLLTGCPHCYNTLKNEYPRFGADFSVVHHADFILELMRAGRIEISRPTDQPITYHDPCYLGRYNEIYDAPREVLSQLTTGGLQEMARSREKSLCCGGGGGQMYLESVAGTRINRVRFAEAEELAVSVIATACPFCKIMMDDAARYNSGGSKVRVKDIAELVAESMSM